LRNKDGLVVNAQYFGMSLAPVVNLNGLELLALNSNCEVDFLTFVDFVLVVSVELLLRTVFRIGIQRFLLLVLFVFELIILRKVNDINSPISTSILWDLSPLMGICSLMNSVF